MKFTAKSEATLKAEEAERKKANLLQPAEYDAEIGTAEDAVSKFGNDMIVVDVTVFSEDGRSHFVKDYLTEKMAFKLRHAAESCGILDKYESGTLMADDFISRTCKVSIVIDDKDKNYAPKNVIKDYIVEGGTKSQKAKQEAISKPLDDSIPF